ncbi:MAG: SIS domain-containing protein [Pseudomonadota bacterium]
MLNSSLMSREASESPDALLLQLTKNRKKCHTLAMRLRTRPPVMIFMIGRGTSDHAGIYAKYLFEVGLGIPVCSAAPSVAGVFEQKLTLENCLAITISQSGRSPDVVKQTEYAKQGGAMTIAIVNDVQSPVAVMADDVLPMHVGQESAVAATKSYLASLSALCHLLVEWTKDAILYKKLNALPSKMREAQCKSAQLKASDLIATNQCVVLGRGFGYAIAREVALKLKEILGILAESYSSAEFLHGPVTLAYSGLLVLNIDIPDETQGAHRAQIEDIKSRGAKVIDISIDTSLHPRLDALLIMQRFYLDIEAIAVAFGMDPDAPVGLKKVTQTL